LDQWQARRADNQVCGWAIDGSVKTIAVIGVAEVVRTVRCIVSGDEAGSVTEVRIAHAIKPAVTKAAISVARIVATPPVAAIATAAISVSSTPSAAPATVAIAVMPPKRARGRRRRQDCRKEHNCPDQPTHGWLLHSGPWIVLAPRGYYRALTIARQANVARNWPRGGVAIMFQSRLPAGLSSV